MVPLDSYPHMTPIQRDMCIQATYSSTNPEMPVNTLVDRGRFAILSNGVDSDRRVRSTGDYSSAVGRIR